MVDAARWAPRAAALLLGAVVPGLPALPSETADVNATFLQPFLTYTTPTQWTFALNTESTYDWEAEQWSVPRASDCGSRSRFFFRGSQLEQSAVST